MTTAMASAGGASSALAVPCDNALRRKPSIGPVTPDGFQESDAALLIGSTAIGQAAEAAVALASEEESISDFDSSPTAIDDKETDSESGSVGIELTRLTVCCLSSALCRRVDRQEEI